MRSSIGRWLLPQPVDAVKKNNWIQIPNLRSNRSLKPPFGYRECEDNPDVYEPIPAELAALEKARKHLKKHTSRQVAAWLTKLTGRSISHKGLLQRLRYEQYNKTKASTLRSWARRYKKAILLAERYEKKPGAKKQSVLQQIGAEDWGERDRTFVNLTTDPDGTRRVYKLCGCRCEHCSNAGRAEHNLQAEPGTTDILLSSK
jgi:hypothetical protein